MPSENMPTLWQLHKRDIIKPYKSIRRLPDIFRDNLKMLDKNIYQFWSQKELLYSDGKLTGNSWLFSLTHRC